MLHQVLLEWSSQGWNWRGM